MQTNELPHDVAAFLHDHVESYEQLELLLLMHANRGTDYTAEALSSQLHIHSSLVQAAVEALQSSGFLEARRHGGETRHAYHSQSEAVEATIGRLAVAYRETPIPIIKLMSANSIDRMRTAAMRAFADAFILRKDTDNG
jgi:predicted transcriptional regulator